jgi:hypothetical protein
MNDTNRAANRFVILVCGLVLLVGGAAVAAFGIVPAVQDAWADAAVSVGDQVSRWLQQTPLGGTGVSWIMPAVLLVLLVLAILLVVFIARQGGGRTGRAVTEPTGDQGTTIVDAAVAEHLLQVAVAARPEFVGSHVSTYRVRRTPVLKVSVTCRRGVSPKDAATSVEGSLLALDEVLGRRLPALIQISGGFRARVTRTTRLQ